jgi:hypothetical protein
VGFGFRVSTLCFVRKLKVRCNPMGRGTMFVAAPRKNKIKRGKKRKKENISYLILSYIHEL